MTRRATSLVLPASLLLLAALPYLAGGGLRTFINLDDGSYVYDNPVVLKGITWGGLRWAFTTFDMGNWHPLTWLSHMLDASLFGSAAFGHHLTSVLLHALNATLLALALARLTGRVWPAWCAAALFGVHPLRVESVAWVAERKDVLAGLFFMLALLAYERYARRKGAARYLLVAVFLALGLMSKPMLVTAPFVLLLLDWWPLGRLRAALPAGNGAGAARSWGRLLLEKVPLLALSAASSAATFVAQKQGGAVVELVWISPVGRLSNAAVSCAGYLGKTVWPASLAIYYPYPQSAHPWWKTTAAVLLLALVSLAALRWSGRRPYFAVGWLWFLGMLVPVIGLVQVGEQALADRYTYLPAVGLTLFLSWGAPEFVRRLRLPAAAAIAVVILALGTLTAATVAQVGRWRDGETLFRYALSVTSENWLIQNNLGVLLAERGLREEAIAHLQEVVRLRPNSSKARNNLGLALAAAGRVPEAVAQYREAIGIRSDNAEAHNNLGLALFGMGRLAEAISHHRRALEFRPDYPEAHNNLGVALDFVGRREEAVRHYREALRLRPDYLNALYNLGLTFQDLGRLDEAATCYQGTLRQKPDFVAAHERLGMILALLGRNAEAGYHLGEARRLRR